jgi:hypothetical protein
MIGGPERGTSAGTWHLAQGIFMAVIFRELEGKGGPNGKETSATTAANFAWQATISA